jgi:DMSO/TMAO reductase YedYZ molybdopterin-dependent catalytic subunit
MMALDLFNQRAKKDREQFGDRLPPGQKLTDGWPVLHYGGIPDIDLATWKFSIVGLVEEEVHFTWDEFMALPRRRCGRTSTA